MTYRITGLVSALALCATGAVAQDMAFNRIATFQTDRNLPQGTDPLAETSAEIVAATADGMTLVYTDSPLGVAGVIDITDPANPLPLGTIALDGAPTAVSIIGNTAFIGVNTSDSFTAPSGYLVAIDLASRAEIGRCDLGGQPDSTAAAPDGSFVAVAVENERDEDAGDGRVPQLPAGNVVLVGAGDGLLDCASLVRVDLTGLAGIAPEDPEPEFVDINAAGEVVVTLQENNHIVVIGRDGTLLSDFPAGAADLTGIDLTEDGALSFTEDAAGIPREPDGIQWIDADRLAVANEGDMDGGSRGFTVFNRDGSVVYDSGAALERAIIAIGHYPERRSDAKGIEPEGMEFATFGDRPMLFVLSERASIVGVYDMTDPAAPVLSQLLPSGVSPEGVTAIPQRNLLVTANEVDLGADGLARASVMIYAYGAGAPRYPYLTSTGADRLIGWTAMSGLVADPARPGVLYGVNDSVLGQQPSIYTIDTTRTPAQITAALTVTRQGRPAQKLDAEGIALDGEGGFWLANEGRTDRLIPHALIRVDATGEIVQEVAFPPELLAREIRFGAEGVTMVGTTLWIALQRPWGDDPENTVKLVAYDTLSGEWGAVRYPTAAPAGEGWVGLSEIVAQGDWVYLVERDNQIGAAAVTKLVTRVPLSEMVPAPLGGPLPVVTREVVRDLIPDLLSNGGYVLDKVEGLAIMADGTAWAVTDNDGVDDSSGETMFWSFALPD